MNNMNTAEKTNPVMDTARLTLSQLAAAGVSEAADCARKLGLTKAMEKYDVTAERITPLAVCQEARFHFMNYYFEQSGCRNIVDLACGFSPRGLLAARKGYRYLGADLQAAVTAMSKLADELSAEEKLDGSFTYEMVDITDPSAMIAATEKMDGSIAMGCEGLLVYLGRYEFESMLQGIANVLKSHGGFFITPDLVSAKFMFGIYTAILGEEEGKKALYALSASIQKNSDTVFKGTLTGIPMDEWERIFERYGLKCELIPFLPEETKLLSFEKMTDEQITLLRSKIGKIGCLKLTAMPKSRTSTFTSKEFSMTVERAGGAINAVLSGRLDSITAPNMLEEYEKNKAEGEITSISIDAAALDYISSAGLRTLLIMQKALGKTKIRIYNVTPVVMDILDQTGFTEIMDVR